jgi:hypothetical protein
MEIYFGNDAEQMMINSGAGQKVAKDSGRGWVR